MCHGWAFLVHPSNGDDAVVEIDGRPRWNIALPIDWVEPSKAPTVRLGRHATYLRSLERKVSPLYPVVPRCKHVSPRPCTRNYSFNSNYLFQLCHYQSLPWSWTWQFFFARASSGPAFGSNMSRCMWKGKTNMKHHDPVPRFNPTGLFRASH